MVKKRGFSACKKAQTSHELMFIIFEIIVFAFFFYILASFVRDVEQSTIFEKNYLARDLAMVINTVYASPQNLVYVYPEITSRFSVKIKNNTVSVGNAEQGKEADKTYWFADQNDSRLTIQEPFVNAINLEFVKTRENTRTLIEIRPTVLVMEFCSEYTEEYACATQKDLSGNNCVPYYILKNYVKCDVCPKECTLDDYVFDWIREMDPCECAGQV